MTPRSTTSTIRRAAPSNRRLPALAVWAAAACASLSCGSPGASSGQPVRTQTIGVAGGTASTANGRLKVQIPRGALTGDVEITIQTKAAAVGTIGPVYDIGPDGRA